ncbi:BQ5605_C011g06485 [Microbotryum silenes-dioicae]|uniref:BQ5605_C011g06485 protein n=1 Tax=Microbotryum silenes-dioicae TaxID=796604 RepID=A0A2X0M9W9_9BASI|nr:BQ5605_C011g06485 [Microbotryum silenes-dioicae]
MMKDYSCLRTLLPMGMFGTGDLMVSSKRQGPYGLPDPPSGASSPLLCTVVLSQRAGLLLSTHSRPWADWLAPVPIRICLDTINTIIQMHFIAQPGLGQPLSLGYLLAISTKVSNIEQAVDTLYWPRQNEALAVIGRSHDVR